MTIRFPLNDGRYTIDQAVPLAGTLEAATLCTGEINWYANSILLDYHDLDPYGFPDSPVGHITIRLELFDRGAVWSRDERSIWVLLGRELLYDRQETQVWRTDGEVDTQVTSGGNPAWSPDGTRIAFVRSDGNDEEIFIRSANGTEQQLTFNTSDDYAPTWSPDGAMLAFISEAPGNPELVKIDIATRVVTRLTFNTWADNEPEWKGNLIAYEASPGNNVDLYVIRDDGVGSPTQLTAASTDDLDPHWSPTGDRIVFSRVTSSGTHAIHIMNANGTGQNQVITEPGVNYREPEISPDGNHIALVSDRSGSPRLWVIDITGHQLNLLVGPPVGSGHPRWKP